MLHNANAFCHCLSPSSVNNNPSGASAISQLFSGLNGNYKEDDVSDAIDLYGKSKYLGEVACKNSVTLRTSIIGHELNTCNGLVDWFLRQQGTCLGYENSIFSGLPTVVLAKIIKNIVIPKKLTGLYHIGSEPISKFNLLKIIDNSFTKAIFKSR